MTSTTYLLSSFQRLLRRVFPNNALDSPADRAVLRRRILKALKFRGVNDQFVGSWILGILAGLGGSLQAHIGNKSVADAGEWFFRNATDLNIWFIFLTIGVGSFLVATHKRLAKQGLIRRLLLLPYLRMTGDAFLLALGAFTSAFFVAFLPGPSLVLGEGSSAMVIDVRFCLNGICYFLLMALFTTLCRVIADSLIDSALFEKVNGHEPKLGRTLLMAGGGAFLVFAIAATCLFYWS